MSSHKDPMPQLAVLPLGDSWLTRRPDVKLMRQPAVMLKQARARGFSAVSIDPFPHLIPPRADGVVIDHFGLSGALVQDVYPRKALLEFARLAKQQGLRLWLSSRFLADTQARRSNVRRPADFVKVWSCTLDLLEEAGLLEQVVAVDFCQRFPMLPAAYGAQKAIFKGYAGQALAARLGWSDDVRERVQVYLDEVPRSLRALFPGVYFGASVDGMTDKEIRALDTNELDFIDRHFWLDDDPAFALISGLPAGRLPVPGPRRFSRLLGAVQGRVSAAAMRASQSQWKHQQALRVQQFSDFCRLRRMSSAMTSGFIQLPQHWYRDNEMLLDISEFMVAEAVASGVRAITPGQIWCPQSESGWAEEAWLQSINGGISGLSQKVS